MKKTAVILIILFYNLAFSSPQIEGYKNVKDSALVEQLVVIVTSILHGNEYTRFKENISPEAYVIYNNTYESIFEVLENPSKKEKFIEVKEILVSFVHLWMPDDQNTAYMVLETKSADKTKITWHSILFKIGENKKWQILSWHKS
jgi:hypothetical protein